LWLCDGGSSFKERTHGQKQDGSHSRRQEDQAPEDAKAEGLIMAMSRMEAVRKAGKTRRTESMDMAMDKRQGVKEDSKRDNKLDAKYGVADNVGMSSKKR
jgi:hypothetical protein